MRLLVEPTTDYEWIILLGLSTDDMTGLTLPYGNIARFGVKTFV